MVDIYIKPGGVEISIPGFFGDMHVGYNGNLLEKNSYSAYFIVYINISIKSRGYIMSIHGFFGDMHGYNGNLLEKKLQCLFYCLG